MDKLVEIPSKDWVYLRDKYLDNWPQHIVGYYTLDNYIKWIAQKPDLNRFHIYSLNGDWSDGTFLVVNREMLCVNTLNENKDRLKKALNLLDWQRGYFFMTLVEHLRDAVYEALQASNLTIEDDESKTLLLYMDRNEANLLQYSPPDGITLKAISEKDCIIADTVWPNRTNGSLSLLKRLAALNPNVGAYDANGHMIAWTFRAQTGALMALQTDATHKRSGLGSLVLRSISQQLASLSMDTFACVNPKNTPSLKMFEKVGFKHIDNAYWFYAYPEVPFEWTDEY